MKAIIISALLFFSVRAMSGVVSEDQKGDCKNSPQSGRVVAPKVIEEEASSEDLKVESSAVIPK